MRFQHRLRLLSLLFRRLIGLLLALERLTFGSNRAVGVNAEDLIEPQSGKKLATPGSAMDDVKMAVNVTASPAAAFAGDA